MKALCNLLRQKPLSILAEPPVFMAHKVTQVRIAKYFGLSTVVIVGHLN